MTGHLRRRLRLRFTPFSPSAGRTALPWTHQAFHLPLAGLSLTEELYSLTLVVFEAGFSSNFFQVAQAAFFPFCLELCRRIDPVRQPVHLSGIAGGDSFPQLRILSVDQAKRILRHRRSFRQAGTGCRRSRARAVAPVYPRCSFCRLILSALLLCAGSLGFPIAALLPA